MKQVKEDRLLAEAYNKILNNLQITKETINEIIKEDKDGPGKGIIVIFAVGGEVMEHGIVNLPFLDAYHIRNHSAEHTFDFDDEGKLNDILKNDISKNELPIMQSFTADDLNVEIFPGVYACLDKGIELKNCNGDDCTIEEEPIYPVLFTPGGSFYNDACKAIKGDYRYLPLDKIYKKLGIE